MFAGLRGKRSAITFDVGAAGIRACQLRGRTAPRVQDTLQIDRMPAVLTGQPSAAALDSEQLSRLVGQGRFDGQDVALVVSPPEVQFFPLRLPEAALAQRPERIEQALRFEVAQESRRAADELEVRYWPLPSSLVRDANVMAVVLASATALEWCRRLAACGLRLRRIDASPCALVRVARRQWTPGDADLWGVLDLGLRHATLTVGVGATPVYIRSLSVASHDWTRQLAAAFEIALPVAEQLKCTHGVSRTERGHRAGRAGGDPLNAADLPSVVSSVLRDSLQTLAQEITRCFAYMLQSCPELSVKRLILAGGGARLRGLPGILEAAVGIPVRRLADETDFPSAAGAAPAAQGAAAAPGSPQAADEERAAAAPPWEHPLPNVRMEPRIAAALGGAMLDWELS